MLELYFEILCLARRNSVDTKHAAMQRGNSKKQRHPFPTSSLTKSLIYCLLQSEHIENKR